VKKLNLAPSGDSSLPFNSADCFYKLNSEKSDPFLYRENENIKADY